MKLIYINNIPHWEDRDGTKLPVIAGGDHIPGNRFAGHTSREVFDDFGTSGGGGLTLDQIWSSPEFQELIASLTGDSGGRTLGFGETREGFQFQAGQEQRGREFESIESQKARTFQAAQDNAMRIAGQKHDKALFDLDTQFKKAQQQRDQAFSRGEREAGQKWQERMNDIQQKFQAKEAEKDRDFQKELRKEDLKAERQRIFVDMMGRDPVRATLFAMGVGGQILPGGERFADLPALKGAQNREIQTETALNKLLQGQLPTPVSTAGGTRTGGVDLSSSGVTGLPPAIKSAQAFQQAGAGGKSVLTSAFGVGDIRAGQQPGINPEEFLQLIDSVTPKGVIA